MWGLASINNQTNTNDFKFRSDNYCEHWLPVTPIAAFAKPIIYLDSN